MSLSRKPNDSDTAVGLLADSVMNEVNNPLSYVLSNLEFLARRLRDLERSLPQEVAAELRETAQDAIVGSKRIRNLMQGLRAMAASEGVQGVAPTDVCVVAETAVTLVRHKLRQRATLVTALADVPLALAADKHLTQSLVTVLRNAAEAIEPGRVMLNEIRVTSMHVGEDVILEVKDTGCGIRRDDLAHVFEPFFTTKASSEGVGLGLSMARRQVHAMGGRIEVASEQGRGTCVRILLQQANAPLLLPRTSSRPPPVRHTRRVLVVDDDRMIGRSIERALEGHDVVTVESGDDALALLQMDDSFDIVLCDLMMPTMSGATLHERVRDFAPHLADRFKFITGGAYTAETKTFIAEHEPRVMRKPLMTADLRHVVENALSCYRKHV